MSAHGYNLRSGNKQQVTVQQNSASTSESSADHTSYTPTAEADKQQHRDQQVSYKQQVSEQQHCDQQVRDQQHRDQQVGGNQQDHDKQQVTDQQVGDKQQDRDKQQVSYKQQVRDQQHCVQQDRDKQQVSNQQVCDQQQHCSQRLVDRQQQAAISSTLVSASTHLGQQLQASTDTMLKAPEVNPADEQQLTSGPSQQNVGTTMSQPPVTQQTGEHVSPHPFTNPNKAIDNTLNIINVKKKRLTAQLNAFQAFLDPFASASTMLDEQTLHHIKTRAACNKDLLSQFNALINEESLLLQSDAQLNECFDKLEQFESAFCVSQSLAEMLVSQLQSLATTRVNANVTEAPQANLPPLNLAKFNGQTEQYAKFIASFRSLVDTNAKLSGTTKLLYLRASLAKEPLALIEHFDLVDDSYQAALDILKNRYHNTKQVIHKHVDAIIHCASMSKASNISIRHIADTVQSHIIALRTLKEPVDQWYTLLERLVIPKLDAASKKEWDSVTLNIERPTIEDLVSFLNRCALLQDSPNASQANQGYTQPKHTAASKQTHGFTASASRQAPTRKCTVCSDTQHAIYNCPVFLKLNMVERWNKVKSLKLCTNCLRGGHADKPCLSGNCKVCGERHSTILHQDKAATALTSSCHQDEVYVLPTASLFIADRHGNLHKCTALLDSGSQRCYITKALMHKLQLPAITESIAIKGINDHASSASQIVHTSIQSLFSDFSAKLSFIVLKSITNRLTYSTLNLSAFQVPEDIQLASPHLGQPIEVDILLGIEVFWHLIEPEQPFAKDLPFLHNTKLGYIISGSLSSVSKAPAERTYNVCASLVEISHQLSQFWELENVPATAKLPSPEEAQCEEVFVKTTKRTDDGKFIVSMPLRSSPSLLGNSRHTAERQFHVLERRFARNAGLHKAYVDFMEEYITLGHMSLVGPQDESPEVEYYIPHHAVMKESSLTTKCRVVFNSSCPSSTGISLNDLQLNGAVLQDDVFSILLRFRRFSVVITADCSKMYRCVIMDPSQRALQRILWRSDPAKPLQTFELTTVTYGQRASSFLSTRCLCQLARECETQHPLISKVIQRDMYIDDLLTSCETVEEAIYVAGTTAETLQSGGFTLRKWSSNHPEILAALKLSNVENYMLEFGPEENSRVLGLLYNSYADHFLYRINTTAAKNETKRTVLSWIATIFDPLGLIMPCTVVAKMFLQELWLVQQSWDAELPAELLLKWTTFRNELVSLNSLSIERRVCCAAPKRVEIHAFADSSERCYGTVVYAPSIRMAEYMYRCSAPRAR